MSFLLDELKNNIVGVINYINNDTLRHIWFIYVDYFDINAICTSNASIVANIISLIYLISFIALPILFILLILKIIYDFMVR